MRTQLLGVKNMDDALSLFAALGYDRPAAPWDLGMSPMPGVSRAVTVRLGTLRRKGYAVVFAETDQPPRSLRPLARMVRDHIHDRSLVVLGVTNESGSWDRMIVMRPRTAQTGGAVTVTKLDIDLTSPTQHDAEVLNELEWSGTDDRAAQKRVDQAFDVEAVTNRFFRGLAQHYQRLAESIQNLMDSDTAVADRLTPLGDTPAQRAALRILTQVLFTQFLQKKGFVEGDKDWLRNAYRSKTGPYYQTVLERLFYAGLGTPKAKRKSGDPDVPYLNGGLFERFYGNISLPLPDELFDTADGLLGYLRRWTFTVHEDAPDESEVAVDPEMLGKVFEHLSGEESIQARGTVYTPRPVVHFMCREALIPWMQDHLGITENAARLVLTEEDPFRSEQLVELLGPDRLRRLIADLDSALDDLHVLDPAVGSGAFPLGMLAEILRLRTLRHKALNQGAEPGPHQVTAWKNDAIRRCLYGVDVEPRAIELCRLRFWLSLLVDLPPGVEPEPLPNLEYRTVVADSLTDIVGGVEVQNTRGGLDFFDAPELEELHYQWYNAIGDERNQLTQAIRQHENAVVEQQLANAKASAKTDAERAAVDTLAAQFTNSREYPCFIPRLHAPDVASRGGWDIVIMNPPYVGTDLKKRIGVQKFRDYKTHYGETADLMVLFGYRALQYARPAGVVAMIFNDSLFTSAEAQSLRRRWATTCDVRALARTRCFEGKAITGGIAIAQVDRERAVGPRWVEGHGKDVADFAAASKPLNAENADGAMEEAGTLEVYAPTKDSYFTLPNRPFFRPSPEALHLIECWKKVKGWKSSWSRWDDKSQVGWTLLSNTKRFDKHVEARAGTSEDAANLPPGTWTLLGFAIEGGIGFQTGDDKRFVAAIEGTTEAERHHLVRASLYEKAMNHPGAADLIKKVERRSGVEAALLAAWDEFGSELRWPRAGTFRIADPSCVRRSALTQDERATGIAGPCHFVPLEKGDQSDIVDGTAVGARWVRDNPVVIDWSKESVALIHAREQSGFRQPFRRNQHLWFLPGVGWNKVASYLRPRLVPAGSVYGDGAIVVRPRVPWLSPEGLCALLGSDSIDFALRTFSSRMNVYIGDIRRLPVPVLSVDQSATLHDLGTAAIEAKQRGDTEALGDTEEEINRHVRTLYGLKSNADLWVVR